MRKPLVSLGVTALLAVACSSSGLSSATTGPVPPDHHQQPPAWQGPAATWQPAPPTWQPPQPTPYGGVTYQDPGTNPTVDPRRDDESTFGLDVDTASYTIAQRYVHDGNLPDPASVRVEEWVNAFDQAYPQPEDATFGIVADGAPTPFLAEDEVLLRVGIQARSVARRDRQPASLTFVIDTSGSMAQGGRLELVKDALRILVRRLDGNDRIAIVTFGSDARVVLGPTPADHDRDIVGALDQLQPNGSTNVEAGLRLGYSLARQTMTENGIDRVVLASDGVANVGLTDADSILEEIQRDAAAGIELVSVGVGMGNYNDALLERLADQGDGFYAYVNSTDEAHALFSDRLTGTLETVALDARAQVVFDRHAVESYRLLGYENRAIPDGQFENDHVPAGAIGAGHAVTALYAIRLDDRANGDGLRGDAHLADVRLRWTDPERNQPVEISREIRTRDLAESFDATRPELRLDAYVAATAELLHRSDRANELGLRDVADLAARDADRLPATDQVHAFLDLLRDVSRIER